MRSIVHVQNAVNESSRYFNRFCSHGRKRSRNQSATTTTGIIPIKPQSPPPKWRSPRRCTREPQFLNGNVVVCNNNVLPSGGEIHCSPKRRLSDHFSQKPKWNPRDCEQMQSVKEALHVATSPTNVICREDEQKEILEFCKSCIELVKSGSLYVRGCPGTGKTLSVDKARENLMTWSKEEQAYCACLSCGDERRPRDSSQEQKYFRLIIVDEMDYLITKYRLVLHDLFMLTTFPFSRCILIGIANAIDLADQFLPKLESLNCKPIVVTFRAYSKDQILKIFQQRLMVLGYDAFQPSALEFCARLNRSYTEVCKDTQIPAVGTLEFTSMWWYGYLTSFNIQDPGVLEAWPIERRGRTVVSQVPGGMRSFVFYPSYNASRQFASFQVHFFFCNRGSSRDVQVILH